MAKLKYCKDNPRCKGHKRGVTIWEEICESASKVDEFLNSEFDAGDKQKVEV